MAARWNLLTFDIQKEDTVTGGNVHEIRVESDERGFELHLETDEGDVFVFNIHGVADDLHHEVISMIGPWVAEMNAARRDYDRHKATSYPDDDGPWPGESALAFYQRTGNDEPLRDQADTLNKTRKEQ